MQSETEKRAITAAYMREHREVWKNAGFVPTTMTVHMADKRKLAAYAEITKFERLLEQVVAGNDYAIELAATRNTPKMPQYGPVEEVRTLATKAANVKETKKNAELALSLLHSVKNYSDKYMRYKAAADADLMDDVSKAYSVIYGNLAVATFKFASALAEAQPKVTSKGE